MNYDDHILIEKYLKNQLSDEEYVLFTKRLETDEQFKVGFELEKKLFDTLNENNWSFIEDKSSEYNEYKKLAEENDIKELRETLDVVSESYKSKPRFNIRTKSVFRYLTAASVILFFGLYFLLNNKTNQDLYNDYMSLEDLPSFSYRGQENNLNHMLNEAERLFESENYESVLVLLNPIMNTNNLELPFYLHVGVSQTELELFKEAENTFEDLIKSNITDNHVGYWYKALLFVKMNRIDDARSILAYIINNELYNYKKAEALLEDLDK